MQAHSFKKYHDEVLARINSTSPVIPAQRKAFRQGYSFSKEPFEQQLAIWDYIWKHTDVFRAQVHAFFFIEQHARKKELHRKLWETSVSWQDDVDDWPLCDALSKINTRALESHPGEVYQQLTAWNADEDLWKRRQSVVSLLYYSRTKKEFLPFNRITALILPLLPDKEYYVQKGVGWALRELHTVYAEEALLFLERHIQKISPIAYTIAVEKMTTEKEKLAELRKKKR